jgi:hypothetical protein
VLIVLADAGIDWEDSTSEVSFSREDDSKVSAGFLEKKSMHCFWKEMPEGDENERRRGGEEERRRGGEEERRRERKMFSGKEKDGRLNT